MSLDPDLTLGLADGSVIRLGTAGAAEIRDGIDELTREHLEVTNKFTEDLRGLVDILALLAGTDSSYDQWLAENPPHIY